MKNRQGISLIETVVALMILGVIGGALMGLTLQITSATNSAKAKGQAAIYAQEAIEQAKDTKNQDFSKLITGCYTDGNLTPGGDCVSGTSITGTQFTRYVKVTASETQTKVQAVVKWSEKGTLNRSVEVDTYFYQY